MLTQENKILGSQPMASIFSCMCILIRLLNFQLLHYIYIFICFRISSTFLLSLFHSLSFVAAGFCRSTCWLCSCLFHGKICIRNRNVQGLACTRIPLTYFCKKISLINRFIFLYLHFRVNRTGHYLENGQYILFADTETDQVVQHSSSILPLVIDFSCFYCNWLEVLNKTHILTSLVKTLRAQLNSNVKRSTSKLKKIKKLWCI